MSFDLHLQPFMRGDAGSGGNTEMLRVVGPYLYDARPNGSGTLRTDDGEAAIYGLDKDGIMINHAVGTKVWDVIVEIAQATGWAIIPIGLPTCITNEAARQHPPDILRLDAVVISTGHDLLRLITDN